MYGISLQAIGLGNDEAFYKLEIFEISKIITLKKEERIH
jgi:hypothetical protein